MPGPDDRFTPRLNDGVITLACLHPDDAAEHRAGEDDDQIRWLGGTVSTLTDVRGWIDLNRGEWATGGSRRNFGVRDTTSGALVGNAEADLRVAGLGEGEVNLSYVVFPAWRGQGIAARAVTLLCGWVADTTDCTTAIIRVAPGNTHSHQVARNTGFTPTWQIATPDGELLLRYEKLLRPAPVSALS